MDRLRQGLHGSRAPIRNSTRSALRAVKQCWRSTPRVRPRPPLLARLLRDIRPAKPWWWFTWIGLAVSVSHLLAVKEQIEASGAHLRSLCDPLDPTLPRGMFSLEVLGAVAQPERALIAKRTKAGLKSARSHSPIGGNPGLRNGDPDAIRKMQAAGHCASGGVVAQLDF